MANDFETDKVAQKNLALALIFFQILGFFTLGPGFIRIAAATQYLPLAFESDPLRFLLQFGSPFLFVMSVILAWMLFARRSKWAAIGASAVPLAVFVLEVLIEVRGIDNDVVYVDEYALPFVAT